VKIVSAATIAFVGLATEALALASFVPGQNSAEQSVGELIGAAVKNKTGDTLGTISYLLIDHEGRVSTAVIGLGGFLGVGEKEVGVPFGSLSPNIDSDGKVTNILDASKEELNAAPAFRWISRPSLRKPNVTSE
jgi:hypothetical protein